MSVPRPSRILVIRLGALGDIVQSFGPFAAIRAHHPAAHITLLTTAPYAGWLHRAPWFDTVVVDPRPRWWQPAGLVHLGRRLRGHDLVYDLQTSGRSTRYFWLAGRPPWSGIGRCRSYPDRDPNRDRLHTIERQRGQLHAAGLTHFPPPDLAWLADPPPAPLPHRYALLIPGAASHRPQKRWPAAHFAELASHLAAAGTTPVLIGTATEHPIAATIRAACPTACDLTGQTDIPALATLARNATLAIGNDTGPMHLAAALGTPCIVLFGGASDPALTAPRRPDGSLPTVLRVSDLADLPVARVAAALP